MRGRSACEDRESGVGFSGYGDGKQTLPTRQQLICSPCDLDVDGQSILRSKSANAKLALLG